jgi:AcrR family transcriptional regulator
MKELPSTSPAKTDVQERILEAAVQLFACQGFSGTSTRKIARLADVNEASLFTHFPSKQDLFWAALQSRLARVRLGKELQNALSEQARPELVLPLIIELLVQIATYQSELIRLLDVGLLEQRPRVEIVYRKQIAPIFQAITDYLDACVKSGVLRGMDPSLTTIALSTTVLAHQCLYGLVSGAGTPYVNSEEAVSAYTKFWLNALRPEDKPSASSLTTVSPNLNPSCFSDAS